jgi:hypothetical protein
MMEAMKVVRVLVWGVFVTLLLGACTTTRVNHFATFSSAGVAYVDTTEKVFDEATNAAIATDTSLLLKLRDSIPAEQRGDIILEHNDLLKERIGIFRDLQNHAKLLRSYFETLGRLAQSDAPSTVGEAASGLADALTGLGESLKDKANLGDVFSAGSTLLVAQFQNAALEAELKARADAINRELALQELVMQTVGTQLQTDLTAVLNQRETEEVVLPYVTATPLPSNWATTRSDLIMASLDLSTLDAASAAARELRLAFVALVEGRFEVADLAALNSDLNRIVALLEALHASETDGG